jgi:glutathione S-transferase
MSGLPILYSFRRCPYAIRARLAVRSSGTAVELREVLLRDKAPEFLDASPTATVPALVPCKGPVIDESLDIVLWALRRNDPEGWMTPQTGSLAAMLSLVEANDGPFKTHLDRYKYHVRHSDIDPLAERASASQFLRDLEGRLSAGSHLFGPHVSLADMAIVPFVRQFANVDRQWFDGENWSHLRQWLETFENSSRFAAIMDKYPKWVAGDSVTVFGA